jgi:hypothetical protein
MGELQVVVGLLLPRGNVTPSEGLIVGCEAWLASCRLQVQFRRSVDVARWTLKTAPSYVW